MRTELSIQIRLPRAWYASEITDFLAQSEETILGQLVLHAEGDTASDQRNAWLEQNQILKNILAGIHGWIFLEFNIPRMGRRVDAIVLCHSVLWVLEFKTGNARFQSADLEQVWDYALDLKYFHAASHDLPIVPVLLYSQPENPVHAALIPGSDQVYHPLVLTSDQLHEQIIHGVTQCGDRQVSGNAWLDSPYRPTPTIIEAARALYAHHSVKEITCAEAGENLKVTSLRVIELAGLAYRQQQKIICFVTGVPGAGKTLVGLDVATQPWQSSSRDHAVYLSGNGPLVAVLQEALARDEWLRGRHKDPSLRKAHVREKVKGFIQNVHHFRDEGLRHPDPPSEHVVIFDEAQRAWNQRKTADFMLRRKLIHDFRQSEPEFLISCMDRHQDWALIICLVGSGQEINAGEAGIEEWLRALLSFPDWKIYASSRLGQEESATQPALASLAEQARLMHDDCLHLAVSMRSFRAERLSNFVQLVLQGESGPGRELLPQLSQYPIVLSRDLERAKAWVRAQARASERYGLLCSSKAQRLKPLAVDVRVDIDPVHWFLAARNDTRCSDYLEDAATEFQVQGLELDWSCVTWDADLRFNGAGWDYRDFHGDRWKYIHNKDNRRYLLNAYRVLLTRARQGMVIVVPRGDASDPTRQPAFYDPTFAYLAGLGLPVLQ